MKENKEGRKKEIKEEETEKDRVKRGEGKKAREKQREIAKQTKMPFSTGKTFFCSKNPSPPKKQRNKRNKKIKEGLGPSEVALWATSPDPETIQKEKQRNKTQKINKPKEIRRV